MAAEILSALSGLRKLVLWGDRYSPFHMKMEGEPLLSVLSKGFTGMMEILEVLKHTSFLGLEGLQQLKSKKLHLARHAYLANNQTFSGIKNLRLTDCSATVISVILQMVQENIEALSVDGVNYSALPAELDPDNVVVPFLPSPYKCSFR